MMQTFCSWTFHRPGGFRVAWKGGKAAGPDGVSQARSGRRGQPGNCQSYKGTTNRNSSSLNLNGSNSQEDKRCVDSGGPAAVTAGRPGLKLRGLEVSDHG